MKKFLIIGCLLMGFLSLQAQKWLPKRYRPEVTVRALGCQYKEAQLASLEEVPPPIRTLESLARDGY